MTTNLTAKEEEFITKLNELTDKWWQTLKNDNDFRIDLRRMATRKKDDKNGFKEDYPQLNVYYGAGSFMRIFYTKKDGFKARIHHKYIKKNKLSEKNLYYSFKLKNNALMVDDEEKDIIQIKKIVQNNIEQSYRSAKERKFEMIYSADLENNILIAEYTGENEKLDDEKIRVDMVRINDNGVAELIELKLSNNDELYNNKKKRNIQKQINSYKDYKYGDKILEGIKKHYKICKSLGLRIAKNEPKTLSKQIVLMIADVEDKPWKSNKNNCLIKENQCKIEVVKFKDYIYPTPVQI